ncbi:hypothetical protein [Mycoplasmopsis felifaucium]|uniref:DUF1934 domain-containing protein n=1 Tax=Mycoplasmopsis felifaucium TaxID=35768 RepID=A0ABZ2RRR3_9BACT|nr:hypothetical protein [Mycoplasmopsis felifaucium]
MKIIFKSLVKQPEVEDTKVHQELDSNYELYKDDKDNEFHTFTFKDTDENKTSTRIEFHPNYVNIFRGPSEFYFELNKERNDSILDLGNGMKFPLITQLKNVEILDKVKKVHYVIMSANNQIISECFIEIEHE